ISTKSTPSEVLPVCRLTFTSSKGMPASWRAMSEAREQLPGRVKSFMICSVNRKGRRHANGTARERKCLEPKHESLVADPRPLHSWRPMVFDGGPRHEG